MNTQNIIEEIYNNKIDYISKCTSENPEGDKLFKSIIEDSQKLLKFFNENPELKQEKDTFIKLNEKENDYSGFFEIEMFTRGFKTGAKFMLDTFLIPQ